MYHLRTLLYDPAKSHPNNAGLHREKSRARDRGAAASPLPTKTNRAAARISSWMFRASSRHPFRHTSFSFHLISGKGGYMKRSKSSGKNTPQPPSKPTSTDTNWTLSHAAIERISAIHQALLGDTWPTALGLSRQWEVNERTIRRDIEFMRDRMHLPIGRCFRRRGYYYTEPVNQFPTLTLSQAELVSICISQRAFSVYDGTPFGPPLRAAFNKMLKGLDQQVVLGLEELLEAISIRAESFEAPVDVALFDTVIAAAHQRQEIEIRHQKVDGSAMTTRQVHPYAVARHRGAWYLIGHDSLRQTIVTFGMSRVQAARLTGEHFQRPENFNLKDHLPDEFGIFSGKPEPVEVEFEGTMAALIQERRWHPSQKFVKKRNGRVALQMRAVISPELEHLVLGWGPEAHVIKPVALKRRIEEMARGILEGG